MFVAVDKAIRDRLTGGPLNRLGNPEDTTRPGIRIPVFEKMNVADKSNFAPFRVVPNKWRQIPVFNENDQGREWETIFPRISFSRIAIIPNAKTYLPPVSRNKIQLAGSGDDVTIVNAAGVTVASGSEVNNYRPLPDAYDLMYAFEIQSKVEYEADYMLRSVIDSFPQRGYLRVAQADGSYINVDMYMQGDIAIPPAEDVALEGGASRQGESRPWRYVVTYIVEGYKDTSWSYYQTEHPAITGISLEMTFPDMPEADNVDSTEGLLEVIDLTKKM